ncbi:MAG: 50S ribosomal protein L32 [Deltaproteobacteria bacterium TMED126]|jgi:large subunit ribosomal protein L32|nr:50S ribosomal protein L32 [Candidatus Dadabacteria bacterium]NSW97993.1 50S ribosomal protein L32 [Deltaproteobacteria bacterium TMED126]NSW98550.1 50S ribosomal protein L32 [bacterium]|tara:strand:+ start:9680 stop:9844 length:165 start_codon:yes stop_codon:yes gene_type:complete
MAVPKRKKSKSKVGKRRNHQKIALPGLSQDKKSGELKVSHRYSSIEDYEESRKA